MEFELLNLDIDGAIATITFNDPDNLNAMSKPMLDSLKSGPRLCRWRR